MWSVLVLLLITAVFKWLSKSQNQSNYSDQSQQEQAARWTNHKFLAITCNSLEAREKSRVHGAVGFGFGFDSHWLKNWRESLKPITKHSNRNHVITFDRHLKTAPYVSVLLSWFCFQVRRVSFALPVKDDSCDDRERMTLTRSNASQVKKPNSSPFTAVKQVS